MTRTVRKKNLLVVSFLAPGVIAIQKYCGASPICVTSSSKTTCLTFLFVLFSKAF